MFISHCIAVGIRVYDVRCLEIRVDSIGALTTIAVDMPFSIFSGIFKQRD